MSIPRMTPRQRVQAALRHEQPERVPFCWGLYPAPEMAAEMAQYLTRRGLSWQKLFAVTTDTYRITPVYQGPALRHHTDVWGIQRKTVSYGAGSYDEFASYPLGDAKTVAEIEAYPWPDPTCFDYAGLRQAALEASRGPSGQEPGYLAGEVYIDVCGNPLEIYTWLTGLERTLINLIERPEVVHASLERITQYFETKMRLALPLVADLVDICYFADDVGGQQGPLFSPRTYRAVIQPYHRRLMQLGKQLVPHVKMMLHTDGSAFDLLPDLIDAGLEVLEAVQVDAAKMEPERLKAAFGDRLSFHGGISVQALLPWQDAETVERECRRLVEVFGRGGGYIAAPSHCIQVGTPPENVLAMLRGVLGPEDYQQALADSVGH